MYGTDAVAGTGQEHFGEHITIDGYGGDPVKLDDQDVVASVLVELCARLRMHALAAPIVLHAPDNDLKDPGGWSGFLVIAESHIALHTFPRRRFLSADVYSCRNGMAVQEVISFLKAAFDLEEIETNFIRRGLRYPAFNLVC